MKRNNWSRVEMGDVVMFDGIPERTWIVKQITHRKGKGVGYDYPPSWSIILTPRSQDGPDTRVHWTPWDREDVHRPFEIVDKMLDVYEPQKCKDAYL